MHKVIHEEVKYITRDRPQAPSAIPPGAKLEDFITPIDYVSWDISDPANPSWQIKNLFDDYYGQDFGFGLYLPIEIKGEKKEYNFEIKATQTRVESGFKKLFNKLFR